jgi:glutathione S-transferase
VMICQYLDEIFGPSSIVGLSPEDRLETRMWLNRVDENILIPMGDAFRSGVMYDFFKARRPGTLIPEGVEGNKVSAATGLTWLDTQMADGRTWVAGERFSLADIRLYFVFSFYAKNDPTMAVSKDLHHVAAWVERMKGTAGAAAVAPKPKL